MNGVTKLAWSVTSPLGKLWYCVPLNHSLGLSVWLGRLRPNPHFMTCAVMPLKTDESTVCQNVRPSSDWPPNHSEPPISVAITPYWSACVYCRAQGPDVVGVTG